METSVFFCVCFQVKIYMKAQNYACKNFQAFSASNYIVMVKGLLHIGCTKYCIIYAICHLALIFLLSCTHDRGPQPRFCPRQTGQSGPRDPGQRADPVPQTLPEALQGVLLGKGARYLAREPQEPQM